MLKKIKMAANVLLHEWHMTSPLPDYVKHLELATISEEELKIFDALDEDSKWHIKKYIHTIRDFYTLNRHSTSFFFNYSKIRENREQRQRARIMKKELSKSRNGIQTLPNLTFGNYESLVAHHGLSACPFCVKEYVRGGVFLDIGACHGDSTLVFIKHYAPQKVIAFEPSPINRSIYGEIMRLNHLDTSKYTITPLGLDKEVRTIRFKDTGNDCNILQETSDANEIIDCQPLDIYRKTNNVTNIRFVKADVEGMGLNVLLGSKDTIIKERPVLSLSIYHNKEELLEIYRTLCSWRLNYHIKIHMLTFPLYPMELSLIAWPKEIEK